MKRKITTFIVIVFVTLSVIVFAQSEVSKPKISEKKIEGCGDKVDGFILCVGTEKSQYVSGEPVVLQISLKNVSDNSKQLVTSSNDYSININNLNGKPVGLLDNSHDFITRNWISGRNIAEVKSMEKMYKSIVLTDFYDLKTIGEYSVVAKRKLPNAKNNAEILSDKITIRIVQK